MTQGNEKNAGEVTLDDLAQMVAGGFSEMHEEMHGLEERLDGLGGRMGRLEAKMDQKFSEVDDRLLNLERTTSETKVAVLDMKEDLAATHIANENNSHQLIGHEHRIATLEASVA
ncbi:MAG: hypothetical protein PHV99_00805 [Candidatus Pacebacteria bacterium]|nr:hypothetical protein [Candidatus Paceibacterota bacterium]